MTRKQINDLIKSSELQIDHARRNLNQILGKSEADGREIRWLNLLIGHTDLIKVLKNLKADDE